MRRGGGWWAKVVLLALAGAAAAGQSSAGASRAAREGTPFRVLAVTTAGGPRRASGIGPIVVAFSRPLFPTSPAPRLVPPVAGTWRREWSRFVFRPAGALPPSTTFRLELAAGNAGPRALDGARLRKPVTSRFTTGPGSLRRAQQLLAELDYLPVGFVPKGSDPPDALTLAREVYRPAAGHFAFSWPAPTALRALFAPGVDTVVTRGALVSFQRDDGLAETGSLDRLTWAALERDALDPARHRQPGGYAFALVDQALPQHLTVFHDGHVVVRTLVNTGIAASPTANGSFLVYERLATQVMRGTDPSGTPYADPVAWVAYFNGGDAIHYMPRASYGYPQSLGCVEAAYGPAKEAWPYLRIGTVVTVVG